MMIFVNAESTEIINIGVQYLRIEGACYIGIGILFDALRILQSYKLNRVCRLCLRLFLWE